MKGTAIATLNLSESVSSILVERTAGTLHATPMPKGNTAFPVRPKKEKILSIATANLAMSPLSSTKDIRKFSRRIKGKKAAITPIPGIIPLINRLSRMESGKIPSRNSEIMSNALEINPTRL